MADEPTVRVFCTGDDPIHKGRRVKVIELLYAEPDASSPDGWWWADRVTSVREMQAHEEAFRRWQQEKNDATVGEKVGLAKYADIAEGVRRERGIPESDGPNGENQKLIGQSGDLIAMGPYNGTGVRPAHTTFIMECRLCGLNLQVREERIKPLLDVLRDTGVGDISLSALAARLA
ncbi:MULTISPECIES: hypothetical protein [unclassified Aeromicrobium]|uniref:hypothetical protein n=1 Tax=unclassified Aeromicrobium TaxID=2633570 RepID=UPI00396B0DCD